MSKRLYTYLSKHGIPHRSYNELALSMRRELRWFIVPVFSVNIIDWTGRDINVVRIGIGSMLLLYWSNRSLGKFDPESDIWLDDKERREQNLWQREGKMVWSDKNSEAKNEEYESEAETQDNDFLGIPKLSSINCFCIVPNVPNAPSVQIFYRPTTRGFDGALRRSWAERKDWNTTDFWKCHLAGVNRNL